MLAKVNLRSEESLRRTLVTRGNFKWRDAGMYGLRGDYEVGRWGDALILRDKCVIHFFVCFVVPLLLYLVTLCAENEVESGVKITSTSSRGVPSRVYVR